MNPIDSRMEIHYAAAAQTIFNASKAAIIKTIEQELWPLQGCFDEIDELIDEFEKKARAVTPCKQKR